MKTRLAAVMSLAVIALAACAANVPDSGKGADEFKYETPEYFNATVGDRVFFTVDDSRLGAEARATLDAQVEWLLKNPDFDVLIEGHADEQGTREYNLALGARRASAVQAYLVSRGIPDGRLSTVTYGKERPVEICSSEACWSKNRRAVSVISAAGV